MEEVCKVVLGPMASPRNKIRLMGEILLESKRREGKEKESLDELLIEMEDRMKTVGEGHSAMRMRSTANELREKGKDDIVETLLRLALIQPTHCLRNTTSATVSKCSSFPLRLPLQSMGNSEDFKSSLDDGCVQSAHEMVNPRTRTIGGRLEKEYKEMMVSGRTSISIPQSVEVDMDALSRGISYALSSITSFIFPIENRVVRVIRGLFITDHSIISTSRFINGHINSINRVLEVEKAIQSRIEEGKQDLPSLLCPFVLNKIRDLRHWFSSHVIPRPSRSPSSLRSLILQMSERSSHLVSIGEFVLHLKGCSVSACLDQLLPLLSLFADIEELSKDLTELLRYTMSIVVRDAYNFMLLGEVTSLGLIASKPERETLLERNYQGGRDLGNRWRHNFGLFIEEGKRSISGQVARDILAEGKVALLRLHDPHEEDPEEEEELSGEEGGRWTGTIGRELAMRIEALNSETSCQDINQLLQQAVREVRKIQGRPEFLSTQIALVINSLEMVWQIFLLGDRVRVPVFEGTLWQRFTSIRDAVEAYPKEHLLSIEFKAKNTGNSSFISLLVRGALSIIVSPSNIRVYTEAHKILSKISFVMHELSEAHLLIFPLCNYANDIEKSVHLGFSEVCHWVSKLATHFCAQTHEVMWRQTNRYVLSSLSSFDEVFLVHRKALKALAHCLFIDREGTSLAPALHDSLDAASSMAKSLQERKKPIEVASHYTKFVDAAQMFTHGLLIEEDTDGLKAELLFLIDSFEAFRS